MPQFSLVFWGFFMFGLKCHSWPIKVILREPVLRPEHRSAHRYLDELAVTLKLCPRLGRSVTVGRARLVPIDAFGHTGPDTLVFEPSEPEYGSQSEDEWIRDQKLENITVRRLKFQVWPDRDTYPQARVEIEAEGRWCRAEISLHRVKEE
ncbi:MAG: hypothetical protein HQ477_07895 [Chloroflexi bacterium]|nr:hypothetical protein [Chloroflexota bacterium]